MVKVLDLTVESISNGRRNVVVSLAADSSSEVDACGCVGTNIIGLTDKDDIVLGSTALCADGNFGMINSNGTWNW